MTVTTGRSIENAAKMPSSGYAAHPPIKPAAEPLNTADWRVRAACRDEDPELFFPVGEGPLARLQEEAAKGVCAGCRVRVECLSWAMDNGIRDGVWGGLSYRERLVMGRKARRYVPASTGRVGAQLAIAREAEIRRWVTREGRTVAQVAKLLGVEVPVAVSAVRALNLRAPLPTQRPPVVARVLEREADLRKLRCEGVSLRRCAEVLGFGYEPVRMAWRLLVERDAAARAQRAGSSVAGGVAA